MESTTRVCPGCGQPPDGRPRFCPECGTALWNHGALPTHAEWTSQQPASRNLSARTSAIIATVCAVATAIGAWFFGEYADLSDAAPELGGSWGFAAFAFVSVFLGVFLAAYMHDELEEHRARRQQPQYSRTGIPQHVKNQVWARDAASCVSCGSAQDLQFDHIIPVSKGGGSTAANIQLLCGRCNRLKSAQI